MNMPASEYNTVYRQIEDGYFSKEGLQLHIASSDGRICGAKRPRCVATVQAVRKTLCHERFLT